MKLFACRSEHLDSRLRLRFYFPFDRARIRVNVLSHRTDGWNHGVSLENSRMLCASAPKALIKMELARGLREQVALSIRRLHVRRVILNIHLPPYHDSWDKNDPHASFKVEVANYTVADPLPSLEYLSLQTGIPTPCLIRYVLVKWAASGAEALLDMSPIVFRQMERHIEEAEATGTDDARLRA
jgi:hypothetical protein